MQRDRRDQTERVRLFFSYTTIAENNGTLDTVSLAFTRDACRLKQFPWLWYHTSVLLSAVKTMWEKYTMNKDSEEKKREKINQKKWQRIWVSDVWVTSDEFVWVSIFTWAWYTHIICLNAWMLPNSSHESYESLMTPTYKHTLLAHAGGWDPKWHHPERQGALFSYCHSTKTEGEAPPRPCASLIQNKEWEKRHC